MELEGTILYGRAFEPMRGRVVVEDGEITAVEAADVDSDRLILPAFVNAHTHVSDSIAKEAGGGLSLEELVAPPDGLKHRLLREASHEELVAAMERSFGFMEQSRTGAFVEFRGAASTASGPSRKPSGSDLESVVLGRETVEAMETSDGFSASGRTTRSSARSARPRRRLNCSASTPAKSTHRTSIPRWTWTRTSSSTWCTPMTSTSTGSPTARFRSPSARARTSSPASEWRPSRNWPSARRSRSGRDNVFLNSPSMFREMEFTAKLADVPAAEVLRMATVNGAEMAGLNCGLVEEGRDARL